MQTWIPIRFRVIFLRICSFLSILRERSSNYAKRADEITLLPNCTVPNRLATGSRATTGYDWPRSLSHRRVVIRSLIGWLLATVQSGLRLGKAAFLSFCAKMASPLPSKLLRCLNGFKFEIRLGYWLVTENRLFCYLEIIHIDVRRYR